MVHYRWTEIFTNVIVIVSCMFVILSCANQRATNAVVEPTSNVKQGEARIEAQGEPQGEVGGEAQGYIERETKTEVIGEAKAELRRDVKGKVQEEAPLNNQGQVQETAKGKEELKTRYVVKKGDCLWWIAKHKDKYNNPELWPLIYKANKKIIKNPDLIYPGQILNIPLEGYNDTLKREKKKTGAIRYGAPAKQAFLRID
jgi:nucleoid-associated protein YgaU